MVVRGGPDFKKESDLTPSHRMKICKKILGNSIFESSIILQRKQ